MFYRSFVGMNWFFIVVLNKGNKIENIICIMITLSFFNKLLSLYFYAIYCECNSFIFRIVQDERKQIAFKSEEHSIFYYLFRVFSLKYHKIEIKKKDITENCFVYVVGFGQSQLCPCDAFWKFYFLSKHYVSHYINCLLCRDSLM